MPYFINVILPLPLERHFTYAVTDSEVQVLQKGMRVAVPFGKSKVYTGIVSAIHQTPPDVYEAKQIEQILDEEPLVNELQLDFWNWIATYYMCSEGEVLRAAVPSAYLLESETVVQLLKIDEEKEAELSDDEFLIVEALQLQSSLKIQEIIRILDKKTVLPVINKLVEKNIVVVNQEIQEQYKPKLERYVKLHPDFSTDERMHQLLDALDRAPKQREVVLSLLSLSARSRKPIKVSELTKETKATSAIVKTLVSKGILEESLVQTDRVQYSGGEEAGALRLNEFQERALQEIEASLITDNVCLLHGVTCSGKTEIYVKLIEKVIASGKQVLYLLPEIALTTQLISRLQSHFGEKVSVFHSKYSLNERVEVYRNVLNNDPKAQVVLGVRSSIFLPFSSLGLIVVDEEHEATFKQYDPAPRYHARDA